MALKQDRDEKGDAVKHGQDEDSSNNPDMHSIPSYLEKKEAD
jgi:hypothetical protein